MRKINLADVPEEPFDSPKGKFGAVSKNVSVALGRVPVTDKKSESHPFDVELCRIRAGKSMCPYHSHSAQFEFYVVVSGSGRVRHAGGTDELKPGDAFFFRPGEAHQLFGGDTEDLVLWIIADDPPGDSAHYPDSNKWSTFTTGGGRVRLEGIERDYFHGEE